MSSPEMMKEALIGELTGTWKGTGVDVFPTPQGPMRTEYSETTTFGEVFNTVNPGGPHNSQTLICVHYITKLVNAKTLEPMHQETGYWLFDSERGKFIKAIAIPRGISILAGGSYMMKDPGEWPPSSVWMNASANEGCQTFGISSDHFLTSVAPTTRFNTSIVWIGESLSYKEDSILKIQGQYVHHTDEATLSKHSN